jgi:hypothetical protein
MLYLDTCVYMEADDFRNANACLRGWSTSLGAADALHLAIASGRGATLCSLVPPLCAGRPAAGACCPVYQPKALVESLL